MSIKKITQTDIERASMSSVANRPNDSMGFGGSGMSAAALKERFSALALLGINKVNELLDLIISEEGEESALLKLLMVSTDETLSELVARINTEMKDKLSFAEAQELLSSIISTGENAIDGIGAAKDAALEEINRCTAELREDLDEHTTAIEQLGDSVDKLSLMQECTIARESNYPFHKTVSGKQLILDDMSTFPHKVAVSVGSTNLFNIDLLTPLSGANMTNNGDGTLTVSGWEQQTTETLGTLCPNLKVGDTVTFYMSVSPIREWGDDLDNNCINLVGNRLITMNTPFVVTEEDLASTLAFRCCKEEVLVDEDELTYEYIDTETTISHIFFRLGEGGDFDTSFAEIYTPFVANGTAAAIKTHGAQLLDKDVEAVYLSNCTAVVEGDKAEICVTEDAKITRAVFVPKENRYIIRGGEKVTLNYTKSSSTTCTVTMGVYDAEKGTYALLGASNTLSSTHAGKTLGFIITIMPVHAKAGDIAAASDVTIKISGAQSVDAAYVNETVETTVGQSVYVDSLGNSMTISCDTEGVSLTVVYNRDIYSVIREIIDAIITLGGSL